MSYNILIIEDNIALSNGIALALKSEVYNFHKANTISEAKNQIDSCDFDLILLDINLPDGNGGK